MIPGITPQHLFASTSPMHSAQSAPSGRQSFMPNVSLNAGVGSTSFADLSASHPSSIEFQQLSALVQTIFHQQQVLQSQLNQVMLAIHQTQAMIAQQQPTPVPHEHRSGNTSSLHDVRFGPAAEQRVSHDTSATSSVKPTHSTQEQAVALLVPRSSTGSGVKNMNHVTAQDTSDERATTPISVVTPPSLSEPPKRSPSKPAFSTPSRVDVRSSPPPQLPQALAPPAPLSPAPHQVVLTWDPKRYSRSNSVTSSSSAHQQHTDTNNVNPLLSTTFGLHNTSAHRSQSTTSQPQKGPSANQSIESNTSAPAFIDDRLRPPPRIVERPAATHTAPPRSQAPLINFHDVSLSDDGYVSMDSAQYMQRYHLR